MEALQFTGKETQLAAERRLKFQGSAKIDLDQIHFDPQSSRQIDPKNVERLCAVFREEDCQNLVEDHRIPAMISASDLTAALTRSNLTSGALLVPGTTDIPHLRFPPSQVLALHGRHRVAAGLRVLPPGHRWWAVDLYLDGGVRSTWARLQLTVIDIGKELKDSLIEEYSNEKPPSDGEIYRKIRQYASDGNLSGELRWKARLCPSNRVRLAALAKNTRLRHAFDGVLGIPGHRSAMHISMLHRILAVKCDEEICHYLNHITRFWYTLVDNDVSAVGKIDQVTVEELELLSPQAEAKRVRGLVISGQAFVQFDGSEREAIWARLQHFNGIIPSLYSFFEDFKCLESWAQCLSRLFTVSDCTVRRTLVGLRTRASESDRTCLVQTSELQYASRVEPTENHFDIGYRQMWLYAMRHYPQMPRDPQRRNRLAKSTGAAADEYTVFDMACLARRLGFFSKEIRTLSDRSPDRSIAEQALLQARKPDRFTYNPSLIESLVDRVVECFHAAEPHEPHVLPRTLTDDPVKRKARCGHPTMSALDRDRPFLFLDRMHDNGAPDRVTTLYVRRCVYLAFFGPLSQSGGVPQPTQCPDASPLFVPANGVQESGEEMQLDGQDDPLNVRLQTESAQSCGSGTGDSSVRHVETEHTDGMHENPLRVGSATEPQSTGVASETTREIRMEDPGAMESPAATERASTGEQEVLARPVTQLDVAGLMSSWAGRTMQANSRADDAMMQSAGVQQQSTGEGLGVSVPPPCGTQDGQTQGPLPSTHARARGADSLSSTGDSAGRVGDELSPLCMARTEDTPRTDDRPNTTRLPPILETEEPPHQGPSASSGRAARPVTAIDVSEILEQWGRKTRASSKIHRPNPSRTRPGNVRRRTKPVGISRSRAQMRKLSNRRSGSTTEQRQGRPIAQRVEHQRAVAFAQLQGKQADSDLNVRPVTEINISGLLNEWRRKEASLRARLPHPADIQKRGQDETALACGRPTCPPGSMANAWKQDDSGVSTCQVPIEPVKIKFYLCTEDGWKMVNVLDVDPLQPSRLTEVLREYLREDLSVHDLRMRAVSISSSFKAATVDGLNTLLLVPRAAKLKGRHIKPPAVMPRGL